MILGLQEQSPDLLRLPINSYQTCNRENKLFFDLIYMLSAYSRVFSVGPVSVLLGILSYHQNQG